MASKRREDDPMTVLLVDVANVVGSRPDGWWRDRAGATTRLLIRLAALAEREPIEVVAVVEGHGRAAAAPEGVTVVRAEGSGDDTVATLAAARAGEDLLVVTADRGLRARLPVGTAVTGPGWLLERLDRLDGA
jgi:nucleotide-binding universal stress UspA family protein